MKISVVINTFNSDRFLNQCLRSVEKFDEIVLCDMHSTDGTIAIAEKYGCRIVYHERTGIVEPARNYAIAQAENEWVLVLDSDEVVPDALREYLYRFAETAEQRGYTAITMTRKNYFLGRFNQIFSCNAAEKSKRGTYHSEKCIKKDCPSISDTVMQNPFPVIKDFLKYPIFPFFRCSYCFVMYFLTAFF